MASWDRARYIPWSKIPKEGDNLDQQKERIYSELRRETAAQQRDADNGNINKQENNNNPSAVVDGDSTKDGDQQSSGFFQTKVPYSGMELARQAAFGGCIGSITGCVFGFMDGMRTAGQSAVLQKASNMAKFKYLMQGTTRSATVFGVFFSGFHVAKYGLKVALDPGEYPEIALAGAVSMGALMAKPAYRPFMPYGFMLISMDVVHIVMRDMDMN